MIKVSETKRVFEMQYTVKQIHLTDDQINQVNTNPDVIPDFYKRYLDATMFPMSAEVIQAAYDDYKVVAKIDAYDLEEVFKIGNGMGDKTAITRLAPMHSVSVGDIVVTEDGKEYYVASFGFEEVW